MRIFLRFLGIIRSGIVWLSFAAIAYWGHATHWTFVGHHASDDAHAHSTDVAPTESTNSPTTRESRPLELEPIAWESMEKLKSSGIETEKARQLQVQERVSALATVTYNGQRVAQLSSRTPGHIWQVYVKPGQVVEQGELLAIVDSQIVGEAKSDWMQKFYAERHARRTYEQLRQLTDGAVPQQRILSAETDLHKTELDRFMAQQKLMNLGLVLPSFDEAQITPEQLSDKIRYLGLPEAMLGELQKGSAAANLISITSPFRGTVVEQHAVVGEVVSTELPMFVVADTRTMWLKLSIRREDAAQLAVGQSVAFTATGVTGTIQTRLAWISSEIDPETRTVQAGCEVENRTQSGSDLNDQNPPLRANQFGNATIVVREHANTIVVPESALQRMPDLREVVFVKVGQPAQFQPRFVKTGVRENGVVQILEGVLPDDEVVTRGSFVLKSEMMRSSLAGG